MANNVVQRHFSQYLAIIEYYGEGVESFSATGMYVNLLSGCHNGYPLIAHLEYLLGLPFATYVHTLFPTFLLTR